MSGLSYCLERLPMALGLHICGGSGAVWDSKIGEARKALDRDTGF